MGGEGDHRFMTGGDWITLDICIFATIDIFVSGCDADNFLG